MNDYKLNGIGSISGGNYENIEVDGIANIQSDITFNELKVSGIVNVNGSTDGTLLEADGIIRFKDNVNVSNINITGLIKAKTIKSESIKGTLNGLHAKQIYSDIVDLEFKRNMGFTKKFVIDGIFGADVKIFNQKNRFKKVEIKEITADNIKLEGVKVNVVRGKNVELINCLVNKVIYDSLTNTNSKIKEEVKN